MKNTFYRKLLAVLLIGIESLIFYLLFVALHINMYMFKQSLGLYIIYMLLCGHYNIKDDLVFEEIKHVFQATIIYMITFAIIMPYSQHTDKRRYIMILAIIMFFVSIFLNRTLRIVMRHRLTKKTLVIGTSEDSLRYARLYNNNRFAITEVLGFVNLNTDPRFHQTFDNVIRDDWNRFADAPIYDYQDLAKIVKEEKIDQITIADSSMSQETFDLVIKDCIPLSDSIQYMPQDNHMMNFSSSIHDSDGLLLISASRNKVSIWSRFAKRAIDILFGLIGSIITIPLALIVKIMNLVHGDHGPIFYKQMRVGRDGKPLGIYKFRSMVTNADEVLEHLLATDPAVKEEWVRSAKLKDDPRITPAGKFLRKTSLDEFPQFFNVLKGDMSLIGPRPVIEEELEWYGDRKDKFLSVRPGLTGYWASHGRSDVDYPERCDLELYYIDHQSILVDMEIVIKTVTGVLAGEGAR